ncbi:MAG: FG-GAP-like repeat-containing protein [Planctomycetota bacterium]
MDPPAGARVTLAGPFMRSTRGPRLSPCRQNPVRLLALGLTLSLLGGRTAPVSICPPTPTTARLPQALAASDGMPSLACGDLDGDGFGDLVVALERDVWVLPGPGLAPARPLEPAAEGRPDSHGAALAAADIDGDGAAEVAVGAPAAGAGRVTLVSEKTHVRHPEITCPVATAGARFGAALALAPIPGGAELAVGAPGIGRAYVWHLSATGDPLDPPAELAPSGEMQPGFGTLVRVFTAAGRRHILVGDGQGSISIFSGVPPVLVRERRPPQGDAAGRATAIAAGDITGDGETDLVVLAPGAVAPLTLLAGPDFEKELPLFAARATSLVGGDVDADLLLDLALGTPSRELRLGRALSRPEPLAPPLAPEAACEPLLLADVNGDGRAEVILGHDLPPYRTLTALDYSTREPAVSFGRATPGSGGILPRLELRGTFAPGTESTLRLTNALGGGRAFLVFGPARGVSELRKGLAILIAQPLHVRPLQLVGTPGSPGAGTIDIPLAIPAKDQLIGESLHVQFLIDDPWSGRRFASTRGLSLTVQPRAATVSVTTMRELRYEPTLAGRPLGILGTKAALVLLLAALAALTWRRPSPWPGTLALAAALLACNLFLDLGQVGLAYRQRDGLEPSTLSPLFAFLEPAFAWPVLLHVVLFTALLLGGARRLLQESTPRPRFLLWLYGLALIGPLTLALSSPTEKVLWQFFGSGLDYAHHALPLAATREFLEGYVDSMPLLSMHASTHGPGPILLLAALQGGLGLGNFATALVLLAAGAFLPLIAVAMARPYTTEATARVAGLLVMLSPSYHLFSFVSMDGVFAVFIVAAIALFLSCLRAPRVPLLRSLALGLLGYAGAFQTFSVSYVGLFAVGCAGLAAVWGLVPWRRIITIIALSGVAFLATHVAVVALTGFDLIACYRMANEVVVANMGIAWRSLSHYVFGVSGNLAAFLIAIGIPASALWLARLKAEWKERSALAALALGGSAAIALLLLVGPYQWEVERIWLFLVPIASLSAARHLEVKGWTGGGTLAGVLGAIWLQALVWELLLNTYW